MANTADEVKSRTIRIVDIETTLSLFYSKTEIDSNDIKKLFGIKCGATVSRLKNSAREVMSEKGVECWCKACVDTECAFEAWKIDIPRLERMFKKSKTLGLIDKEVV